MVRSARHACIAAGVIGVLVLGAGCGAARSPSPERADEGAKASGSVSAASESSPDGGAPVAEASDDDDPDALVLLAKGDPDVGPAPLEVQFSAKSLLGEAIIGPHFTWDFGDGSPISHEVTPTHVYRKPGEYTVQVKVVDAAGQRGEDELEVVVLEPGQRVPGARAGAKPSAK